MPKRVLQGDVVSDKNDKTIVMRWSAATHPLLKKTVRRSKKYHAHDEENRFKVGDQVAPDRRAVAVEEQAVGRRRSGRCPLKLGER